MKLSNQARFVEMIIGKDLVESRGQTSSKSCTRSSSGPFCKAAGETEDVEANDDAKAEVASGTDYLTGMAI